MEASTKTIESLIIKTSLAAQELYFSAKQDINILHACDNTVSPLLQLVLELRRDVKFVLADLNTSYRALIASNNPIEKRLNLKNFQAEMHESYKLLYGFSNMRQYSTWARIGKELHTLAEKGQDDNYELLLKAYNLATTIILKNESTDYDKNNRDLTYHYDEDMLKVYQSILEANDEEAISQKFISILCPFQIVLLFADHIELVEETKGNMLPKVDSINSSILLVQRIKDEIIKDNGRLEKVLNSILQNPSRLDTAASMRRGISDFKGFVSEKNPLVIIPEADNMIVMTNAFLLLQIMLVDVATIVNAFIHSNCDPEYVISLRRLTITRVSTLSQLYGYSEAEHRKSLWASICSLIPESDKSLVEESQEIRSALAELIDITDKKDRTLYSHLMNNKRRKSNVPEIISKIEKVDCFEELKKADSLLRVTKRVQDFLKALMNQLAKDAKEKSEASRTSLLTQLATIRELVNNSQSPESLRSSFIEQIVLLEEFIKNPLFVKNEQIISNRNNSK